MKTDTKKTLFKFISPYSKWLILCSLCSFILILFNILRTYYIKTLVDNALSGASKSIFPDLLALMGLSLIALILMYGCSYFSGRFTFNVIKNIKYSLFQSICKSSIKASDNLGSGDLISRSNYEMNTIQDFLQNKLPEILYVPIMFIASSIYMIALNWKLYVLCYAITPICIFCITKLNRRSVQYSKAYYESLGSTNNIIKECIDGIDTIKTYNLSDHLLLKCKNSFNKVLTSVLKSEIYDSCQLPLYFILYEGPKIFCLLFGGFSVIKGYFSLGELIAYGQLILFISDPINKLSSLLSSIRKFNVAFNRIDEILNLPVECTLASTSSLKQGFLNEKVHIEVKKLNFSYDGLNNILNDVSFKIPAGKRVAIVGPSGEGKTTLLNLIASLYTQDSGEILLNHIPYSKTSLSHIRNNIAYVSQDSFLFPLSIRENISLWKSNASYSEIELASKAAKSHDFIMSLPDGYDTLVSEHGNNFSGGQKQRLSIARALLKGAPILLMDEPTSALDGDTETALMNDIFEACKDRTLIISTHRYSTIKNVDVILVVSNGKIAETGNHDELISLNGIYTNLYNKQFSMNGGDFIESIQV